MGNILLSYNCLACLLITCMFSVYGLLNFL